MAKSDSEKKQIPLRFSTSLFRELSAWAEDDFRSLNGQIEYLLTESVRRRRKGTRSTEDNPNTKIENDLKIKK